MRTRIEIDDKLIEEAMAAGGFTSKKAAIETALRFLVQRHKQCDDVKPLEIAAWAGGSANAQQEETLFWRIPPLG
jgi:Arc/MetJ family transcription regulator